MTNPKATMKHTVRYDFNALLDNADFLPVMIFINLTSITTISDKIFSGKTLIWTLFPPCPPIQC